MSASISGWFGIRKSFSQFVLSTLPCLQEYGNINYHSARASQNQTTGRSGQSMDDFDKIDKRAQDNNKKNDHLKPVVPIISIDMPD